MHRGSLGNPRAEGTGHLTPAQKPVNEFWENVRAAEKHVQYDKRVNP